MKNVRIDFADVPWTFPAPGQREKEIIRGDRRLRLVELSTGFADNSWCERAHVGFLLEGELIIEFPDGNVHIAAGEAFVLSGSEWERHRAWPAAGRAVAMMVEDIK